MAARPMLAAMAQDELPVYQMVGEDRLTAMVHHFYAAVPGDPILGPMYPAHDLAAAEVRLREFLIYRLGGPPRYIRDRGHPRLRMRHGPFAIDQAARDRWLLLMGQAMVAASLPDEVRTWLHGFLGDIATFLINRP